MTIEQLASGIEPPGEDWRERARARLDTLTKPIGSLGRLEDLAAQIVSICQDRSGQPISKAVYVFAADHGVAEEGVSAYPREVTQQMVLNFLAEGPQSMCWPASMGSRCIWSIWESMRTSGPPRAAAPQGPKRFAQHGERSGHERG